jgi:transposase
MDETRVQVLSRDKAPTAEHWTWVRASGPPHRRIILFDYDPSRGGTVPMRLLEGFTGILQTDGYEAYCAVAEAKRLVHAGCYAHTRRKFGDARKAQVDPNRDGQSKVALDLMGQLYRIERDIKTASLVETAKANGLEPHAYLSLLFAELPRATALEHFEALLPWNIKPAFTHHV